MMEVFPTPDDPSMRILKHLVSVWLALVLLVFLKPPKLLQEQDFLIFLET